MASNGALRSLLKHARETIDERLPTELPTDVGSRDGLDGKLNEVLFAATTAGQGNLRSAELSIEDKTDIWCIVCKLWNYCTDMRNKAGQTPSWMVALRQHASNLLELVKDSELSMEENSIKLAIYHKTGKAHAQAGEHEAAEASYCRAQEQSNRLMKDLDGADLPEAQLCEIMTGCLDLLLDRLVNAWKLQQQALASDLLTHATELTRQQGVPSQQRFHMCRQVIIACTERGLHCLQAKDAADALKLLDHAFQLITGHLELDEDDPDFERFQKEAGALQTQVLRLLSQAYLSEGQPAAALQCLQNIRKLDGPLASSPAVCLTAIQALTQLDEPEQADAELLALAAHTDASLALCLEGLSAVIALPCCGALKPAADLILERFGQDATVPLRIGELILCADAQKVSKDMEAVVLGIATSERVQQLFRKAKFLMQGDPSTKELCKSMYTLLWNYGTQQFSSKDYRACVDIYAAALAYADAAAKAVIARQLALAHLALNELDRSLDELDTAAEYDPSSVYTIFVRIKVLLTQGDARKAVDLLRPLMACEGFSLDFLRASNGPLPTLVVNAEADLAKMRPVAKEAVKHLWEQTIAAQGPSSREGDEAAIARNLIRIAADMAEGYDLEHGRCKPLPALKGHQGISAEGQGSSHQESVHQELAGLFSQVETRLEAVGFTSFFGKESPAWFAAAAFNAGLAAMQAKDMVAATVLFRASGSIHEAYLEPTPQSVASQRKAYTLAASCTLEEHSRRPGDKTCLSLAQALLKKASVSLEAAAQLPTAQKNNVLASKQLLALELELVKRQGKHGQMLQLIERARTEGLCSAQELLQLAEQCRKAPHAHAPAVKAALSAALQRMRSQERPPPMETLAETIRQLYELSTEQEALQLLADVTSLVKGLEPNGYPRREMSWLVSTAWNRGCRHVRFMHYAQALPFMEAALGLMGFSEDFKDQREELARSYEQTKESLQSSEASLTTQAEVSSNQTAMPSGLAFGKAES